MSETISSNVTEFTVSELSGSIKKTVERAFSHVRLRGEISGFRGPHSSGHAYFSIKDDRALMDAVVWKGVYNRLKFKPEEGMEMIATGKITTYPGSSKYQIVIEQLEPAGAGALMAMLEERKKRLAAEGLFNAERKQLLPYMPNVIGVVTSPTGAVIRDILHRISDRFPVHVLVWPVRVQGETSGDEVARAITGFNALDAASPITKPDLIIVARGGGSLEDLWGFNDEAVVRAAAQSDIPLISAVGHETDWTLLDLVADQRAPTPTGAAEMAVPVKEELNAQIANLSARLQSVSSRIVEQRRQHFLALSRGLPSLDNILALPRRRIDEAASGLFRTFQLTLSHKKRILSEPAARLTPLSLTSAIKERYSQLTQLDQSLRNANMRGLEQRRGLLQKHARGLAPIPQQISRHIRQLKDQTNQAMARSDVAIQTKLVEGHRNVQSYHRILESLSYRNVLKRGYAIVKDHNNRLVKSVQQIGDNQDLSMQFADGQISIKTSDVTTGGLKGPDQPQTPVSGEQAIKAPTKTQRTKIQKAKHMPKQATKPTDQGSLF